MGTPITREEDAFRSTQLIDPDAAAV